MGWLGGLRQLCKAGSSVCASQAGYVCAVWYKGWEKVMGGCFGVGEECFWVRGRTGEDWAWEGSGSDSMCLILTPAFHAFEPYMAFSNLSQLFSLGRSK